MNLDLYSTPLWFGFIQAWIYAILLWYRGWQKNLLSDFLLGLLLVGMAFSIWEYMLGFSGINILWEELEFFPRSLGFAFPPIYYFYFKSQVDSNFRFSRKDIIYFFPFIIHTIYHVGVFAMGHDFVMSWKQNFHNKYGIPNIEFFLRMALEVYFFYRSLKLYLEYRNWTETQFSDTEKVSFKWFRNFLIVLALGSLSQWGRLLVDSLYNLTFYENWWDNLVGVFLIYYVCITGYAQAQPTKNLIFNEVNSSATKTIETISYDNTNQPAIDLVLKEKIDKLMAEDKLYLEPELTLADVANRLKTNISIVSGVVNSGYNKNFNDFVNEYRVNAVKAMLKDPKSKHLSLLGIAFDCGFNSKSTFNRAFKKFTNVSPKDFQ